MNLCFVLVDLTTDTTPVAMRPAQALSAVAAALTAQTANEFAAAYGSAEPGFRVASSPSDRTANEIAINFRDTIPEAPGALAYHQVTNGVPDIEIGVDLFSSLTTGTESVSSGVSHEVLETLGDLGANGWKDKGTGVMGAEEVCDPVQNTGYAAPNGAQVSNFVLPNYFIPGSEGPWDFMKVMQSQADLSNGYEVQTDSPTSFVDALQKPGWGQALMRKWRDEGSARVAGKLSETQAKRKRHQYSRASRRGVKF